MPRYKHDGSKKTSRLFLFFAVFIALLVGATVAVRHHYQQNLKPVSTSETTQLVTVELGATVSEIADTLKEKQLIREAWAFEWYVRNNSLRDKLQAGSYYISPSQDIAAIAGVLTRGKVATDLVTILPGKRIDQLKQSLVNDGFEPSEVEAAFDPSLYTDHSALVDKPAGASLEGYIYPETFQKDTDTTPSDIIRSSLDQMQLQLTPDVRAGIVRQGLTVHQGVILASIIEKEVGVEKDRPTVAQVFLSRLKIGMKLQSDATTPYGAVLDGKEPLSDYDSAYNTYLYEGLTPGPISNVSGSSLQAVVSPSNTEFIYFVAGNDCVTRFSKTLPEHEAFIAQHGVGCR